MVLIAHVTRFYSGHFLKFLSRNEIAPSRFVLDCESKRKLVTLQSDSYELFARSHKSSRLAYAHPVLHTIPPVLLSFRSPVLIMYSQVLQHRVRKKGVFLMSEFPSTKLEALTMLYLQKQDLSHMTPSEFYNEYCRVYNEIKNARNNHPEKTAEINQPIM